MARPVAVAAVVVAFVVALVAVLSGGGTGSYEVRAVFLDAGQLVKGNVVQVAGRRIGLVTDLRLTDDGRAEVVMDIADDRYKPLHRGTRMAIRTVGLSGIANRFIDVSPGSENAPEIEDGGVLGTTETTGIVDLDVFFNALGPKERKDIRTLLVEGARGLRGREDTVNRLLRYLDPGVAQGRALLEDVTRDQQAVDRLLRTSAQVSAALADRRDDLSAGIETSATTLRAIGDERTALQDALTRAPSVLAQGRGTLARVRTTLREVRPALREARPVAPRLATTLRRVVPVTDRALPVVAQVDALLVPLRRTLRALPALRAAGVPALRGTVSSIAASQPIFEGLRPYALDVLHGAVLGPGDATGHYDANGMYARVQAPFSATGSGKAGVGSLLPDLDLPSFAGQTGGNLRRCPGAALLTARARDGSTPYLPAEAKCDR